MKIALRFRCVRLFLLGVFLICTQQLSAEEAKKVYDLPLDQLANFEVVSASRFKQKSSEAPSSVEVLTAENIRSYGWRTLADALNSIRGVYIRNDRNYTYLGNRGFSRGGDYNSRTLIMIDGRRMNETIFDSGFIAEEFMLDMNLIERIEYIPGTGSSVYGANALLGVVNVITKRGRDIDGVRLGGEAGSLDTYRGRVTFGKQWKNGAELLLNGSHFSSHGNDRLFFPQFSDINGGIAQDMDQERTSRGFGKFSFGDFTLQGGYVDRLKRIPTAAFGAIFNDRDYYSVDSQGYLDLDYLTQINADLGLEIRGFHHWYDYYAITPYDGNEDVDVLDRIINFEGADARWWGGEVKLTGTQFEHHKWVAGVEVQHDGRQHYSGYDITPPSPGFSVHNNGWRVGAYFQDEFRITKSLLLNAGLRLDHHHMLDNLQLNPRIGLIWDITPSFTAKLLYGSAFRAPNVLEHDLNTAKAKPVADEQVKSYEAVAEWYPGGGVKLLGTVFYNDMARVIVQDPATFNSVNAGKFNTLGFELGMEKLWDNGRQLKLTWTHNNTRDLTFNGGGWAYDSPKNMVKAHYAEPLFNNRLRIGFEEIFVDERRTLSDTLAPSYHLFNINLALTKPIYGFQASLGVYNVLDQHFKVVGGPEHNDQGQDTLTMDGREVRFRLEYGF
ncbi:TonB-dependent receptor [Methyloglobulus sp.]|uniref:TonB-dependent receptor plug domain-containing protein n=1 Tax=Methyloglobulus sp. TaxID=2518622 RepID=UPI0032B7E84C